jgi:hypothetical protein
LLIEKAVKPKERSPEKAALYHCFKRVRNGQGSRNRCRLDAESYEDQKTADFIHPNFLPVKAHIKEHPAWFHRFDACLDERRLFHNGC